MGRKPKAPLPRWGKTTNFNEFVAQGPRRVAVLPKAAVALIDMEAMDTSVSTE